MRSWFKRVGLFSLCLRILDLCVPLVFDHWCRRLGERPLAERKIVEFLRYVSVSLFEGLDLYRVFSRRRYLFEYLIRRYSVFVPSGLRIHDFWWHEYREGSDHDHPGEGEGDLSS